MHIYHLGEPTKTTNTPQIKPKNEFDNLEIEEIQYLNCLSFITNNQIYSILKIIGIYLVYENSEIDIMGGIHKFIKQGAEIEKLKFSNNKFSESEEIDFERYEILKGIFIGNHFVSNITIGIMLIMKFIEYNDLNCEFIYALCKALENNNSLKSLELCILIFF